MKNMRVVLLCAALAAPLLSAFAQQPAGSPELKMPQGDVRSISPAEQARDQDRISREVRHELLMLPYFSVFDDLKYSVQGNTVALMGDVRNATLKDDAEKAVKHIEGVERVENRIHVLSPSPNDDRIRMQVLRTLMNTPGLDRYFWSAVSGIHIISDGGHLKLEGVVDSEGDKNLAGIKANGVPGVFSVQNDLMVANQKTEARK